MPPPLAPSSGPASLPYLPPPYTHTNILALCLTAITTTAAAPALLLAGRLGGHTLAEPRRLHRRAGAVAGPGGGHGRRDAASPAHPGRPTAGVGAAHAAAPCGGDERGGAREATVTPHVWMSAMEKLLLFYFFVF